MAEREGRVAWLAAVPATVADLADRWDQSVGEVFQSGGVTACGA